MRKITLILVAVLALASSVLLVWKAGNPSDTQEPREAKSTKSNNRDSDPESSSRSQFTSLTDTDVIWQERVEHVKKLGDTDLSDNDISTLYNLLHHTPISSDREDWFVIVNEIMEQLRVHGIDRQKYFDTLLSIAEDAEVDEVIRDYSIQHLGQSFNSENQEVGEFIEADQEKAKAFLQTLTTLIQDPELSHSSLSGTGLIVLADLYQQQGAHSDLIKPHLEELGSWITTALDDENSLANFNKVTVINAIGMLNLTKHTATIRDLSFSDTADPSVRLCSISSLGEIGNQDDIDSLRPLTRSKSPYKHAAKAAINNLTQKFGNLSN